MCKHKIHLIVGLVVFSDISRHLLHSISLVAETNCMVIESQQTQRNMLQTWHIWATMTSLSVLEYVLVNTLLWMVSSEVRLVTDSTCRIRPNIYEANRMIILTWVLKLTELESFLTFRASPSIYIQRIPEWTSMYVRVLQCVCTLVLL